MHVCVNDFDNFAQCVNCSQREKKRDAVTMMKMEMMKMMDMHDK